MTWMPLHGRVFGSRFYSLALRDPRAGLAALKLWWEAWQQCPAGSLPDDDFDLARMADFGSDARGWGKAKVTALHGFVLCADGRLYHPLICAEAMEAWDRRRKERDRKADQRARKTGPTAEVHGLSRGTGAGHTAGQDADVRADRTGQDRTEKPSPSAQDARAGARGTRLPVDWQPSAEDRAYAEGLGLDCRRVAEDFRGYWLAKAGKDAVKVDWSLTWQNQCRREADRRGARPGGLFPAKQSNLTRLNQQEFGRYADVEHP